MSDPHLNTPKIFGGFDAVYIINLPSRTDRRSEMQDELARVGLSLISPGVILFPAVRPTDAGPFPTVGARGCFLSHLGVIEQAVEHGFSNILILEDDCNLADTFILRTKQFFSVYKDQPWGFFYGGTLTRTLTLQSKDGFADVPFDSPLMGSHCMGINGPVLGPLAQYLRDILQRQSGDSMGGPMHVDGAYSWFRREHCQVTTILTQPQIAFQRSSKTDIHSLKWYDRISSMTSIVNKFRKIKNSFQRGL